jgi:hypothetical protein
MDNDTLLFGAIGLALIGFGLFDIFKQDKLWEWQERNMKASGLIPKRTQEWESRTLFQGCVALGVGIVIVVVILVSILVSAI